MEDVGSTAPLYDILFIIALVLFGVIVLLAGIVYRSAGSSRGRSRPVEGSASRCTWCGQPTRERLCALALRGVPHGDPAHDVVHDGQTLWACGHCNRVEGYAFSHDCWSYDEPWDMDWTYVCSPEDSAAVRARIATCPAPLDPACECAAHQKLRNAFAGDGVGGERQDRGFGRFVLAKVGPLSD
jgi:hypothetical protein